MQIDSLTVGMWSLFIGFASIIVLHILLYVIVAPFLRQRGVGFPVLKGPFWVRDVLSNYYDWLHIEEQSLRVYKTLKILEYVFYIGVFLFMLSMVKQCSHHDPEAQYKMLQELNDQKYNDLLK